MNVTECLPYNHPLFWDASFVHCLRQDTGTHALVWPGVCNWTRYNIAEYYCLQLIAICWFTCLKLPRRSWVTVRCCWSWTVGTPSNQCRSTCPELCLSFAIRGMDFLIQNTLKYSNKYCLLLKANICKYHKMPKQNHIPSVLWTFLMGLTLKNFVENTYSEKLTNVKQM